jgi:hypothetical protein
MAAKALRRFCKNARRSTDIKGLSSRWSAANPVLTAGVAAPDRLLQFLTALRKQRLTELVVEQGGASGTAWSMFR